MKQTIYILTLAFGLVSCNNQTTEKTVDKNSVDTLQTVPEDKQKLEINIKNKSQYDQSFIDGLSEYNEPVKLMDNYILIGQDTVYFPEELQLNKETIFQGNKDQKKFVLSVTRTNLTSLNYHFQILDKDSKAINNKSGRATLGSLFFLGSETDDDDETSDAYLSVEYWDNASDCSFAIRIGEMDENGKLRVKIKLFCKDNKSKNIGLDDTPTLRTE
ncbi:MAG: hypothetical protein WBB32_14815 [Flavobacteriales bacterium]